MFKLLYIPAPNVLAYAGDATHTPSHALSTEIKSAIIGCSRHSLTDIRLYIHGSQYDNDTGLSTVVTNSRDFYILAQNNNGTPVDHVPFAVTFFFTAEPLELSEWRMVYSVLSDFQSRLSRHHQAS